MKSTRVSSIGKCGVFVAVLCARVSSSKASFPANTSLLRIRLSLIHIWPVYAAWTGLGIALTAVVGAVVWKEGFNVKKALGLAAIIGGVVVLKLGV